MLVLFILKIFYGQIILAYFVMFAYSSVLGLWNRNLASEPRLHLSSFLLREAVEKRYFGNSEVVRAVHLLIAGESFSP